MKSLALLVVGLCVALRWFGGAAPAFGSTIMLTDQNSTVTIDPYSSSGVESWTVDGTNQLHQQWFWYRVGSSGQPASIVTLSSPTFSQPIPSEASISYSGSNGLVISVKYTLTGQAYGSGGADLDEAITVSNTSSVGPPLPVQFFEYSNFTLSQSADYVQFQGPGTADQSTDPSMSGGATLAETVLTPSPNYRQVGYAPNLLDYIETLLPGHSLTDTNGNPPAVPFYDPATPLGPADVSWAYEWDRNLGPGGILRISKDKLLSGVVAPVPEPASLAIATAALIALFGFSAHRRRVR